MIKIIKNDWWYLELGGCGKMGVVYWFSIFIRYIGIIYKNFKYIYYLLKMVYKNNNIDDWNRIKIKNRFRI